MQSSCSVVGAVMHKISGQPRLYFVSSDQNQISFNYDTIMEVFQMSGLNIKDEKTG